VNLSTDVEPTTDHHRVSQLATLINGFPFDSADFSSDAEVPLVRIRDLGTSEFETFVPRETVPRSAFVRDGDVVIGMDGDFNSVLWDRGEAALNQRVCLLRARPGVDPRYIAYAIPPHLQVINDLTWSTTVKHLSAASVRAIRVPAHSGADQRAIADYLDRETTQIDAFIAKNEELITLLTERRASVLSAAMGEVSSRMRLRQVLTVAQTGPFGTQLSASEYIDDGVPVINPSHIVEGVIAHDAGVSVSIERAGELSRFRLSPDDIVLGRKGEVDKAALVDEESDGYLCGSDSMMLRPSKRIVHPKYLWWFLQSPPAHEQLERFAVGSTVVGLNQRTLRVVQLPVPSLERQKAITADLNRATAAIRDAMSVAKRSVELARERRAALISAAVTGKIDVGVAA